MHWTRQGAFRYNAPHIQNNLNVQAARWYGNFMTTSQLQPDVNFEPAETMTVDDLDTLKVLADPLRLRIRELMEDPTTVKQVATELGIPATKLYYHINLMEKHGLIQLVDTRVVSGIIEKHYQMSARVIRVAKHLLSPSAGNDEGLNTMLSLFDVTKEEVLEAVRRGWAINEDGIPRHKSVSIGRHQFYLTEDQAADFHQRIHQLIKEFHALSDEADTSADAQDRKVYRFLMTLFPSRPKPRNEAKA